MQTGIDLFHRKKGLKIDRYKCGDTGLVGELNAPSDGLPTLYSNLCLVAIPMPKGDNVMWELF